MCTPSAAAASCNSSPAISSITRCSARGPRMSQCVSIPRDEERLGEFVGDERAADRDGRVAAIDLLGDRARIVEVLERVNVCAPSDPGLPVGLGRPPVASSSASYGIGFCRPLRRRVPAERSDRRASADAGRCDAPRATPRCGSSPSLPGSVCAASAEAKSDCKAYTARRRRARSRTTGRACAAARPRSCRQIRCRRSRSAALSHEARSPIIIANPTSRARSSMS